MKRKQIASLFAVAICCCSVQANAEALNAGVQEPIRLEIPAQSPEAVDEERAERYYRLGLAELQRGYDARAADAFREAIRADWTDARVYWERGKLFQRWGDKSQANYASMMSVVLATEVYYMMSPETEKNHAEKRQENFGFAGSGPANAYCAALWEYERALALGFAEAKPVEIARRRGAIYGGLAALAATVLRMEREEATNFHLFDLLEPDQRAARAAWRRQDKTLLRQSASHVETDFDKALLYYSEALRLSPTDAEAYADRGAVYYNRGRFRSAEAGAPSGYWAERFVRRTLPENAPQFDLRDYAQAAADYKRALALKPQDGTLWLALGRVYESAYADANALAAYTHAAEQPQTRVVAMYNRAKLHLSIDERDKALEDMHIYLSEHKDMSFGIQMYRQIDAFKNSMEEIVELTNKIDVAPQDGALYEARAAVWARAWKFLQAIDDYSQAEKRGVQNAALYWNRGKCYWELAKLPPHDTYKLSPPAQNNLIKGFRKSALADYERAGALGYLDGASKEEKTKYYSSRANARLSQRQYAAASADLTQMIRSDETSIECYFKRSLCYRKAGFYHLAASDLLQVLLRRSAQATASYVQEDYAVRAYRALGELYADDLHDDAKALEAYDALLRLSPKDDGTRLRRALLLDRLGEEVKAATEFRLLQKGSKAKLRERIPETYRLPLEAAQAEEQARKKGGA